MSDATDRTITLILDEADFANVIAVLKNADDPDHTALLLTLANDLEDKLNTEYETDDLLEAGDTIELVLRIEGEEDVKIECTLDTLG